MASLIDIPCCLRGILVSGFNASDFGHFQTNDTQSGPVRVEFLTDAVPMPTSVAWSFDPFEFQVFEAWFRTELNYGSVSFNINLWVGMGLVEHECNFINPDSTYKWTKVGKRFAVTAQLSAVAHQYNNDCDSAALLALCGITSEQDTCAFLTRFQDFANGTLPDEWENMLGNLGTDYS